MLNIFVTIPLTSFLCERIFSNLSLIKTKLFGTMHQDRLDGLLTMSIDQEFNYSINIDDVIKKLKIAFYLENFKECILYSSFIRIII